jgi:hypothetical protein
MAKQLIANGHTVTMVFAESPRLKSPLADVPYVKGVRRGQFEGIDLIEFNIQYSNKFGLLKRALIFLKFSFKSVRLVFTEPYDLVYATTTPLTAGIPGIIMKFFGKKKPFVFEVREQICVVGIGCSGVLFVQQSRCLCGFITRHCRRNKKALKKR